MWQTLAGNLAVVALFVTGWNHAQPWLEGQPRSVRRFVFAILMGTAAACSMLLAVNLGNNIFLDLRTSVIATAGLFGGPLVSIFVASVAGAMRLIASGSGLLAGLSGILVAAAIGIVGNLALRGQHPTLPQIGFFAFSVGCVPISTMLLLADIDKLPAVMIAIKLGLLTALATALSALAILHTMKLATERDILHAALVQAPDFQYIKNEHSQFVAVNQAVAENYGRQSPRDMQGLTDFDVVEHRRAFNLFKAEQTLLQTGVPLINVEERVNINGVERWFLSSKSRLCDADGRVVGLAGVSRDITERKMLETNLRQSRDQLAYALAEMTEGLAMFDADARLVYCNQQYRDCFPKTAHMRVAGANLIDIMLEVAATGEQVGIPQHDVAGWAQGILQTLSTDNEQEIKLYNGNWIRIRTHPTRDGTVMVLASDITRQKEAERVLTTFNDQLKILAETDGLTGLVNRRTFDLELDRAIRSSEQERSALSLLLIDIDRFKAFNDGYGHIAGDECLRTLSACFKSQIRPSDTVARYGGEEFALILRDTDERSAVFAANRLLAAIRELALPHLHSEQGIVTASIGVANYEADASSRQARVLVAMADKALYSAKAAGRNRAVLSTPMRKPSRRAG